MDALERHLEAARGFHIAMLQDQQSRDREIARAYNRGRGLSTRRIAAALGISFQRVAQIIRKENTDGS